MPAALHQVGDSPLRPLTIEQDRARGMLCACIVTTEFQDTYCKLHREEVRVLPRVPHLAPREQSLVCCLRRLRATRTSEYRRFGDILDAYIPCSAW